MARLGKPAARRFRLILKGKFQERSARVWRMTNPNLWFAKRFALISELMKTCTAVRLAILANDQAAEATVDRAVGPPKNDNLFTLGVDGSEHNCSRSVMRFHRGHPMTDIKEHMEVIGADGVHVGTVDKVEGNRIKLTKKDSGEGSHKGHHHFIDKNLVAEVEGNKVRLSAIGAVAVTMEEEK
jgi:hypothetical protein